MKKSSRMMSIILLTPLLVAVVFFILYTSEDPRWGGGFWEDWLVDHIALAPAFAHLLVFWFRKSMHFLGYGSLGLLYWLYFYLWRLPKPWCIGLPVTVIIAVLDEYTQSFAAFRSGKPGDVLIDTAGILLFYFVAAHWMRRKRFVS